MNKHELRQLGDVKSVASCQQLETNKLIVKHLTDVWQLVSSCHNKPISFHVSTKHKQQALTVLHSVPTAYKPW